MKRPLCRLCRIARGGQRALGGRLGLLSLLHRRAKRIDRAGAVAGVDWMVVGYIGEGVQRAAVGVDVLGAQATVWNESHDVFSCCVIVRWAPRLAPARIVSS